MLARTFGCARVAYNDAHRVREVAHASGERITDSEIQRRVITLAKTTPERERLAEVSWVALIQACRDAHTAYRNWFAGLGGTRKGRRVGHPKFRSRRDNRQAVRLTRNRAHAGKTLAPEQRETLVDREVANLRMRIARSDRFHTNDLILHRRAERSVEEQHHGELLTEEERNHLMNEETDRLWHEAMQERERAAEPDRDAGRERWG